MPSTHEKPAGEPADVTHSVTVRPQISVQPSPTTVHVVAAPAPSLLNPSTYAPAIPGVLVAVVGFYVVHKLTQMRDREKQAHELCEKLKRLADEAAKAAIEGWLAAPGENRAGLIDDAKRQLQSAGMAATYLKAFTAKYGRFQSFRYQIANRAWFKRVEINVLRAVADLRKAATADPFEDTTRQADSAPIKKIHGALGRLMAEVDRQFLEAVR